MKCPKCGARKTKTLYFSDAIQKWCISCGYKSKLLILPKENSKYFNQSNLSGELIWIPGFVNAEK